MADYVSLLDAAYAQDRDEERWLYGLARATDALLGRGIGVVACSYDMSDPRAPRVRAVSSVGSAEALARVRHVVETGGLPETFVAETRNERSFALSERRALDIPVMAEYCQMVGARDMLLLNGSDPQGLGTMLAIHQENISARSARKRAVMDRVSAHLATAVRMRNGGAFAADPDVRFRAGKVQSEWEGEAGPLDDLLRAVRAVEAARKARGTADLSTWRSRVDARWTLVAEMEKNGVEYIVARRSPPAQRPAPELTERERQVVSYLVAGRTQKLVAYELGLSPSTVRVLVSRALAKLGVASVRDLLQKPDATS